MFDFYQRRKLRAVLNSPIAQMLVALLAFSAAWSAYVRYDIAMEMADRRAETEASVAALEARREELAEQVRYLESERGIEAELRRQFDVALPGEQVVVIVEEEGDGPEVLPLSTTTASSGESQHKPWYRFW